MSKDNGKIAGLYQKYSNNRSDYLRAAYDSAKLTIPSLFPEYTDSGLADRYRKQIDVPWSSLGARLVNNVASKLLIALFPPGQPMMKYFIDPSFMPEGDNAAEAEELNNAEKQLAKRELALTDIIEADAIRPAAYDFVRQLVVAGNVLLHFPEDGGMRVFRMNRYVVKRDATGKPTVIILKETMDRDSLPENVREIVDMQKPHIAKMEQNGTDRGNEIDLYTCIKLMEGGDSYEVEQEVCGVPVPDAKGTYPADAPEFVAMRMARVDGEDYARGLIEEYIGDIQTHDGLQRSILNGAVASAEVKFLVDPASDIDLRELAESDTGTYLKGRASDVTAFQTQKSGDLQVAMSVRDNIAKSLGFAFLLNSAVQRTGDRVTAEEIRQVSNELETSFGGIFSQMQSEFQRPLVARYELLAVKRGALPPLPKLPGGEKVVEPVVITGLDAIGRSQELDKIEAMLQYVGQLAQFDPMTAKMLNTEEVLTRLMTALGIKRDGLIRNSDDVAAEQQQEQQQMMQQDMVSKATGPAVAGMSQGLNQGSVSPEDLQAMVQQYTGQPPQ